MIRLCITGGRYYRDRDFVFATLDRVHRLRGIAMIIHGATPTKQGADWLADDWAMDQGIKPERYPVDHAIDGPWPGAGPRRNARMLLLGKPDGICAFPGDRGTKNCVDQARRRGIPVWEPVTVNKVISNSYTAPHPCRIDDTRLRYVLSDECVACTKRLHVSNFRAGQHEQAFMRLNQINQPELSESRLARLADTTPGYVRKWRKWIKSGCLS